MASTTASSQPLTKQELYDRIRASSRDEVILDEMIRLGFWPAGQTLPADPADDIRQRGELERELRALRTEQSRLYDEQKLIAALRKKRLQESKEKQKATKERREKERQERADAWAKRKETELLYLGDKVSWALSPDDDDLKRTDEDKLQAASLPVLHHARDVADLLGLDMNRLRYLTFDRKVSTVHHYRRFSIAKKTGGERFISAPMPQLKEAQRRLLDVMFADVEVHPAAHGFLPSKSIVSNAAPHVGKDVVVNMDLKDFFPTVTYVRVRGLFFALGYSMPVSTVLALLCTEAPVDELELDGKTYFMQTGERALPQGAPTSPMLTNLLCKRLDQRIQGIADKHQFAYTRYADDLTFSSNATFADVKALLVETRKAVRGEGFWVHPEKTRVMRKGRRQEVTGVVVNDQLSVERKKLRQFRAFLHQLKAKGPEHVSWNGNNGADGDDVFATAMGFARFVHMVDVDRGRSLIDDVKAAMAQHGYVPPPTPRTGKPKAKDVDDDVGTQASSTPAAAKDDSKTNDGKTDKKPWWKIF